jgi:hypothetical protein
MSSVYKVAGPALLVLTGSALLEAALTSGCYGTSGVDMGTDGSTADGNGTTGTTSATTTGTTTGTTTATTGTTTSTTTGTSTGTEAGATTGAEAGTTTGAEAGPTTGNDAGQTTGVEGGTTTGTGANINSGAGPWGTPVAGGPTPSGTTVTGTVTVNRSTIQGAVGTGFAGFSFEKTHITNSTLTGTNAPLIALYKLIGPTVLRLGANDVDRCTWDPTAQPGPGGPPYSFNIGTAMVDGLGDFLTATGARIIYGVNYHSDNVPNSAAEATYAQTKLASSVYGFEIGNEIDKYGAWSTLQTQWESFATAILKDAPAASLIGPASTGGASSSLTVPFAEAESAKFGDKLVLLTQHYYTGSANTSSATVATLQTPKSDIASITTTVNGAAVKYNIPDGYRFGECNTFSGHGQMGVSDTLISGLWSLDLMFLNAEHGSSGVNFHGGETGMDGTKPFYYEPIMENNGVVQMVMPVYYSMLLFYLAGQGQVLGTTVTSSDADFTAYSLDYKTDGSTSVVLDNKNAATGVQVTVNAGTAVASASAIYLQGAPANSLTAASVTLAGAEVSATGVWKRNPPFIQTTSGNMVSVYVPPASAALVRIQ